MPPDPPPPRDEARRVFGERAAMYTRSASHADAEVLARLVSMTAPRPEWRALDIATGTGHTALALAPRVREVIGLDLTPEMLAEAARSKEKKGVTNYSLVLGEANRLPFASSSFDLVTCRRAAHHFRDPAGALGEMRRVLRPGGRLVIDDRSVPDDDEADALMNLLDTLHDRSHVREYRALEWNVMLRAAGLGVEEEWRYLRHRPVRSLTEGVAPADAARVRDLLAGTTGGLRRLFDVREVAGELHCNHWFVMLSARSPQK